MPALHRDKHPLTSRRNALLCAAYRSGQPVQKIARTFNISKKMVFRWLTYYGLYKPHTFDLITPRRLYAIIRRWNAGETRNSIASHFNLAPSSVRRALRRAGVKPKRIGRPRKPTIH